jgi:gentisate 1,2-dioxygenase
MLTDEPARARHGAEPPAAGSTPNRAVHYPAAEIMRRLDTHIASAAEETRSGQAVLFTSAGIDRAKTATSTLALAINSLEPGGDQLPHRHNAAALTLALECDGVYSMIDGERVDWSKHAVMLTPPTALHAHHNRGDTPMMSLVAQDGGLFYYARAIGFGFG